MDFTRIDALHAQLQAARPLNAGELARLRDEFIIENTYNSNAIEGSTLTLRETALILQEGVTIAEKPLKEHLEVIGHKDALAYVAGLVGANTALTEHVVKELHALVLMHDAANKGIYRRVPVMIMGAMHSPPQPYLVPVQMEELLAWYGEAVQSMHIIEAVAAFHLRFESIHPFVDGNGRTGRLLMNLELIKADLLPVDIKFTDRRRYYDCFDAYHAAGGTAEALAQLIAGYEVEELEKRLRILAG